MNEAVKKIDVFALGWAAPLYYCLMFYVAPTLTLIGASSGHAIGYEEVTPTAALYALAGLGAVILGYVSGFGGRFSRIMPNVFGAVWREEMVPVVFIAVFLLGLLAKVVRIFSGGYSHVNLNPDFVGDSLFSAVGLFTWFGPIAMVIAFAWYYHLLKSGREYTMWRSIAWGTLIFELFYAAPSCSREAVIIPILLLLLTRWYCWRRSYAPLLVVAGVIIFLIMPLGNLCRNVAVAERIFTERDAGASIVRFFSYAADSSLSRTNQLFVFSKILDSDLPRLYGRDYYKFFVSLGPPRFLWKNKPVITQDGNEFGHKIGVLAADDVKTSVGPTAVGDFYMNFGLPGIIGGMFLLGVAFRFFYDYFITLTARSLSGTLIYGVIWIQLLKGLENWQYPIWAGLIKTMFILTVIHWLLTKTRKMAT